MQGGVGAFTQELAKALAPQHDIFVLTSRQARPAETPKKVATLFEPIETNFGQVMPTVRSWRWPMLNDVADWAIRYELDVVNIQYQAAAYHMRSPAINLLPWRLRRVVKTAVTFHDLRVPYLFPKAGRLRELVVWQMARQAHGIIVTNMDDKRRLEEKCATPIVEIPIGSNITAHSPNHIEIDEVRDDLNLKEDDILLGYFGFLNHSKGADALLKAMAQLDKRFHTVFIGGQTGASDTQNNQHFLADLRRLIDQLGLNGRVHWTGYLYDRRVSAFLHAADLMVMPYRDGASLRRGTLMAALAHGRPLISTWPIGPTPQLKHGENIWFVPVDDADAIVTAVQTVSADAELRQRMGASAKTIATHFSWEGIAQKTADFLITLPVE